MMTSLYPQNYKPLQVIFLANQEKQKHVIQIKGLFADIYYGNKGCKYNQYIMLNIGDGLFGDTFAHS